MRHPYRLVTLAVVAVSLIVLAGCRAGASGSSGTSRTVAASEFKFDPASITVPAGSPVTITLQNKGTVTHDFTVQGMDSPFQITADAGKSTSGTFTPTKAGTYRVICTQPAHEQSGMVAQLVVQ